MNDKTSTFRASDVLSLALPKGSAPLADSEIMAGCEKCGSVPLSTCFLTLKRETTYTCAKCCEPLLILALPNPDETPWMEGAYRLNQFVIWHAGELRFRDVVRTVQSSSAKPASSAKARR
jgi:hypothetical protein